MASNNPYSKRQLDRAMFQPTLQGIGARDFSYARVGNAFHMSFRLDETQYLIEVYENRDGSTTLARRGTVDKESYTRVAEILVENCTRGDGKNFSISIPRFPSEDFESLKSFLVEDEHTDGVGAVLIHNEPSGGAELYRYQGPQGHRLTIKWFSNGTLQLQGLRTIMAAEVLDFLATVLTYERAVRSQLDTYKVDVSVQEVSDELEGRMPNAFSRLHEVVRAQLVSSLALTKVEITMPDYGGVAFPALRGLEGFLKHELANVGFDVKRARDFGEYFKVDVPNRYKMRPEYADVAGEPAAGLLAVCYTFFHGQRHGIAHVGAALEATRILGSLDEAVRIVTEVLGVIEDFCTKIKV